MIIIRILNDQTLDYIELKTPEEDAHSQRIAQWSELPSIPSAENLFIILPGEMVTMTTVTLPKMAAGEKLKAIPFALEEQIASDPENIAVAMGAENAEGALTVAITDVDYFERLVEKTREMKLMPNAMMPDYLSLRWEPNTWSVLLQNDMALVRVDYQNGFSIDANNLSLFLSLLLEKNSDKKPQKMIVWKINPEVELNGLEQFSLPVEIINATTTNYLDPQLASDKPALNLLQGKYRIKRAVQSELKRNWIICASVAAVFVGFLFVSNIIEFFYYRHQANALQTQALQAYQVLFPGETQLEEPRTSTKHLLEKMKTASANTLFLKLMNVMGESVLKTPTITVQAIEFDNHSLKFTVQSPNLQVLSQWTQSLRSHALTVHQNVLKTDQSAVQAEMIVSESKSK